MSIIEKSNPLNLQYKICVVTNASSPLGVVICKTLLKANALVLGIDKNPRDESLNAGLGTHFQFEERDINGSDGDVVEHIVAASKEKFEALGGKLDVLVNLVRGEMEGIKALTKGIGDVMRESGEGSIITVADSGNDKGLIDFTKSLAEQHEGTSIRTNMIVSESTITDGAPQSGKAYEVAKTHMTALIKTERPATQSKHVPPEFYEVGNLFLFLAGGMSEDLSGKVFALDGSYRAL